MKFEELVNNRKKWVKLSEVNNFDFNSILAGLYADPSHFIYELLQNAEDEGAKKIKFELFEDRLDVYHNGKVFDIQDIDGVTGIGISKKKEDLNLIGKFGVGFKSVFAVTETPYIFSGEYKIRIDDFVIPTSINDSSIYREDETLIRIPFNHKYRPQKEIFELVRQRLENLGLRTMLFLKNIEEIEWKTSSSNGHYLKSAEDVQGVKNTRKVTLVSASVTEEYLVIRRPITIEGKELWVEVAYKFGKDKNGRDIVIPEPDSKLVVFFPTEKVTFLNFVVQGPFRTTPNRENIPLEDEQNKIIIEEIGNLVADSLPIVKDLGYLDVNFFNVLPLDSEIAEREPIYSVIYKKVKEKFLSEKLLPTSDGKYAKAGDVLLARGKELTEFLDNNDIQKLFSKQNWLDANITYDKKRELRDYLINELEISEIDFESFAKKITVDFLQSKSDEWMIDFYRRLLDQQSLWSERAYSKGILRTKPIIRLENNEHIAPYDNNGRIQVYLPTETPTQYKTVKRVFTQNEESLKFLKELGLTKPDLFAEIREFILPKYKVDKPVKDERYFDDFAKLLKGYENIPSNKKDEFVKELSATSFIYGVKNDNTGEGYLLKPGQVYFSDEDLRNYFNGYQSVYFVSEKLYEKFGEEKVKKFLKELGVEDKPRRLEICANLSREEKELLRGKGAAYFGDIYQKDYELEGLKNFLNNITSEKSQLLWRLLLKSIQNLGTWEAENFFKGEYSWYYHFGHTSSTKFDAKFLKILKQEAWLVDKNNNLRKASEIAFSDLSDNYDEKSPNIDVLKKVLGFKPAIIDQLPENEKKLLEVAHKYNITNPEELERILAERAEQKEEPQWQEEYKSDDVPVNIEEVEPAKIVTPDLSGQSENLEGENDGKSSIETKETEQEDRTTPVDKKAIGKWGEEYVYRALKETYQRYGNIIEIDSGFRVNTNGKDIEIIWLNKHQDKGKGYDFVIKENGDEIEYIEVKSKTEDTPQLIEVGGTQWEWARKLFDEGKGERYSFYVVLNAGKENAKIHILKNPIQLWRDGKLYAHPVNFKL